MCKDSMDSSSRGSRSREVLRAAAVQLLDERSSFTITVTEVAAAAGVTRPTFYQAFDDLPELFTAAALSRLEGAFALIDANHALSGDSLREAMGDALEIVLGALARHEQFFHNVLDGPAAYSVISALTEAVSARMGQASPAAALLATETYGPAARTALAAGTVWMVIDWLNAHPMHRPPIAAVASEARDFIYHSIIGGLSARRNPLRDDATTKGASHVDRA